MDYQAAGDLFRLTDRELWLATARHGDRRGGCVATFVCQASLPEEAPRALLAVARHHYTWELIEASGAFGLHLLGEAQLELAWRFGLTSGRGGDKLAGLTYGEAQTGSPLLSDALGWLDCRVESRMDTGDRTVFLAEVVAAQVVRRDKPLTAQRLMELATDAQRMELAEQRRRDSQRDASAIGSWRAQREADGQPLDAARDL